MEQTEYKEIAEFGYTNKAGQVKQRRIGVIERSDKVIKGFDLDDNNQYKAFNIEQVVGGKDAIKYIPLND